MTDAAWADADGFVLQTRGMAVRVDRRTRMVRIDKTGGTSV